MLTTLLSCFAHPATVRTPQVTHWSLKRVLMVNIAAIPTVEFPFANSAPVAYNGPLTTESNKA
jgi:hypothetical protein